MKSKTRRYLLGTGLLVVLVAGALVLALPTLAARGLEDKITAKLGAQTDVQATWSALDVSFGGELELTDLHVTDAERGVDLRVERIYIKPTLMSLFEEEPEIQEIRVEGTTLELETLFWVKKFAGGDDEEETPGEEEEPKKEGGALERLKRSLKSNPPRIIVERARALTTLEDAPVAEFELIYAELKGGGDEPLELTARGHVTTQYEKVPKLLRQRHSWDGVMRYDLDARQIVVDVSSGDEGEPLLDLELPRIARGKLGKIHVELDLKDLKSPRVTAEQFYLKLGGRNESDLIAMLQAETLGMTIREGAPVLTGRATKFDFTPSKFKELSSLRDRFKPLGGTIDRLKNQNSPMQQEVEPTGALSRKQALEQLGKMLGWGAKLSDAMGKLDVELEQGAIVMHVPGEENALRAIELVSELDVSLREGHLMMTGSSAEGSFLSDVIFLPGQALPHSATLVASGVNLGKLPGMDQGRTLPNRGIKGRIGGVVDLSLHLLTPLTGVALDGQGVFDEVTLRGVLNWHEGMLDVQGVADEPLTELELDMSGALKWYPGRGEFTLEETEVRYNGLEVVMEGSLRDWPLDPELRLNARMPETPCQEMVDALPDAMLGPYRNVSIEGSAAPVLIVTWPLDDPQHLEVELDGFAAEDNPEQRRKRRRTVQEEMVPSNKTYNCKVTQIASERDAWPEVSFRDGPGTSGQARAKQAAPSWYGRTSQLDVYWLNQPFVKRVTEGVSEDAEVYVGPGLDTYVPLSSLPPWVGGAAYLSEEILFFENRGVSFGLIRKALRINFERGRFVYGGSTVTQQLVKNLFLTRDKTLARKLQEALISLRMDEVISKERILELYLNCIEFGPDLYGIGPASRFYFNKEARDLTPMESLFLATIKPSPSYGGHLKRRGNLPPEGSWFIKRFDTLFKRMVEYKVMTQPEVDRAKGQVIKWVDGVYAPEYVAQPLDDVMQNLLDDMMAP